MLRPAPRPANASPPRAPASQPLKSRTLTAPTLNERRTAVIGATLVALGPVSMALYTPAMPELVSAFGTSLGAVKATLTFYFAGFALAQLICGPLSDAYGRRPVSIVFLSIYVVASLAAVLAPTVGLLTAARLFQGIGAAVGTSMSRAIVRDNFTGEASSRVLNTIGIFLAVGPALSPTFGSLLLLAFPWEAIFWVMVGYGLVLLGVVLFALPETNRAPDPARAHPGPLVRAYAALITDRRFLAPALAMGVAVGGLYALGTVLPFLLVERAGLSPQQFGMGMLMQSGSYILGGIVTKAMMRRVDAAAMVLPGLVLTVIGAAMMVISALTLPVGYLSVMLPVGVFAFSLALIMPDLSTRAMAAFPDKAGAAAALLGFIQMGSGFAGSGVAALTGDPITSFALVVPAMAVVALAVHLLARRPSAD